VAPEKSRDLRPLTSQGGEAAADEYADGLDRNKSHKSRWYQFGISLSLSLSLFVCVSRGNVIENYDSKLRKNPRSSRWHRESVYVSFARECPRDSSQISLAIGFSWRNNSGEPREHVRPVRSVPVNISSRIHLCGRIRDANKFPARIQIPSLNSSEECVSPRPPYLIRRIFESRLRIGAPRENRIEWSLFSFLSYYIFIKYHTKYKIKYTI